MKSSGVRLCWTRLGPFARQLDVDVVGAWSSRGVGRRFCCYRSGGSPSLLGHVSLEASLLSELTVVAGRTTTTLSTLHSAICCSKLGVRFGHTLEWFSLCTCKSPRADVEVVPG